MLRFACSLLVSTLACASAGRTGEVPSQLGCFATVRPTSAVFRFPGLWASEWPIHQPRTDPTQTTVEYWWSVSWSAPAAPGLGQRELSLIHRWEDASAAARWTLPQLVSHASRETLNENSRAVGDGAVTAQREPAFRPRAQNDHLWFELNGGATVSRYFAMHPDSVTFAFEEFGIRKLACRAQVEYR